MREVEASIEVSAPAADVWNIITDVRRSAEVVGAIDDVVMLADEAEFGIGTRWRETRTTAGKPLVVEMEVISINPGNSYVVEVEQRDIIYVTTISLTSLGPTSCLLAMTFAGEVTGLLPKLRAFTVGRLSGRSIQQTLQQELVDIKAAVESQSSM